MESIKSHEDIKGVNLGDVGAMALCIDHDHITISVDRFTELVKKEAQLEIVSRAYFTSKSYDLQERLSIVYGPIPEPKSEQSPIPQVGCLPEKSDDDA